MTYARDQRQHQDGAATARLSFVDEVLERAAADVVPGLGVDLVGRLTCARGNSRPVGGGWDDGRGVSPLDQSRKSRPEGCCKDSQQGIGTLGRWDAGTLNSPRHRSMQWPR